MKLEILSMNQKRDLVLKTLLVDCNGVVSNKTLAQICNFGIFDIQEVVERLKIDGFIQIDLLNARPDRQQISITAEGKLFTSLGGYTGRTFKIDNNHRVNYGDTFHNFSKQVNCLTSILLFMGTFIVLLLFLCYINHYTK
ncbi:hypothetical protein [Mucilaginibacter sp. UYCu711]|uniref:hypothetical protein n=1 Tax=Mucilaginibacter sp. UYCu711 TaxID=3156339 RepID=UPI003D1E9FDD